MTKTSSTKKPPAASRAAKAQPAAKSETGGDASSAGVVSSLSLPSPPAAAAAAAAAGGGGSLAQGSSYYLSVVSSLKSSRLASIEELAKSAKELDWSFDPRPCPSLDITLADVLREEGILTVVADKLLASSKVVKDLRGLAEVVEGDVKLVSSDCQFDEALKTALALNVLFRQVPADFGGKTKVDYKSATSKDDLVSLFSSEKLLNIPALVKAFPYISVATFGKVPPPPKKAPTEKAGMSCFARFESYMLWLYGETDKMKADSYGKLQRAMGRNRGVTCDISPTFIDLTLSNMGGSVFGKDRMQVDGPETFAANSEALAKFELLTAKLSCQTYTSDFAYNVNQSDYDGSLAGIATYAGEEAEGYIDWGEFLQAYALGEEDISEFYGLRTSAFYIPGMKKEFELWESQKTHDEEDEGMMDEEEGEGEGAGEEEQQDE